MMGAVRHKPQWEHTAEMSELVLRGQLDLVPEMPEPVLRGRLGPGP